MLMSIIVNVTQVNHRRHFLILVCFEEFDVKKEATEIVVTNKQHRQKEAKNQELNSNVVVFISYYEKNGIRSNKWITFNP